ncbi:MAG TPA: cytochrome c [Solirubrobacteraceae bacterium]|nr:cytochrome c [Solirubrobacteraceae bacterium]
MSREAAVKIAPDGRPRAQRRYAAVRTPLVLLALAGAAPLSGCGSGSGSGAGGAGGAGEDASSATIPFTPQEARVERGARLFVSDGCAACHSLGSPHGVGPSFARFAGDRVVLADGRRALVDESFLRTALLHPRRAALRGYPLAPMAAAVARLDLAAHPEDVRALAAFIEQVGPEEG